MKKVLIVFNHPAPYKVRLFNGLAKSLDLHVIFERHKAKDRDKKFYFENKYDFIDHKIKGIPFGKENFFSLGVKRHIKQNKYDLIIMNGYSCLSEMIAINYMKRKGIPYVLYINGGIVKKDGFLKKNIKTHFIKGAKAYLSPDEQSNKYLIHYGASKDNIFNYPYSTIFENEIIKQKPNKESLRKELSIVGDKVFVSSGQLIKRKNYLTLVNEWKKLPNNYSLYLIGSGNQRTKIQKKISKLHLTNVKLLGHLDREDSFKYFRAADAFLFPSKEDIYGHVINEALSQGIPVISTCKVNAAIKLIKDSENGFVLDSLTGEPFATAINTILAKDCYENCVTIAKENTVEKMVKTNEEIIKEVIEK